MCDAELQNCFNWIGLTSFSVLEVEPARVCALTVFLKIKIPDRDSERLNMHAHEPS